MANSSRQSKSRIVIETPRPYRKQALPPKRQPGGEVWVAISVVIAAGLATFVALFVTSRPFDPMNASLSPQQVVPSGPAFTPTPRPSASTTPTPETKPVNQSSASLPGGETPLPIDDAAIQSRIESALGSDAVLSKLDISTLIEGGKVTIVGSVRSVDLKQRVERTIRSVKGVVAVDNQLVVTEATPQ